MSDDSLVIFLCFLNYSTQGGLSQIWAEVRRCIGLCRAVFRLSRGGELSRRGLLADGARGRSEPVVEIGDITAAVDDDRAAFPAR